MLKHNTNGLSLENKAEKTTNERTTWWFISILAKGKKKKRKPYYCFQFSHKSINFLNIRFKALG